MRKLKFKAWDKKENKWCSSIPFNIIGEWAIFDCLNQHIKGNFIERLNDIEIVQFTGRIDKHNNEIYEGDIIKNANGVYLEIYWNNIFCQFKQRICNKDNIIELGYVWLGKGRTDEDLNYNCKEIIGNKYENP